MEHIGGKPRAIRRRALSAPIGSIESADRDPLLFHGREPVDRGIGAGVCGSGTGSDSLCRGRRFPCGLHRAGREPVLRH